MLNRMSERAAELPHPVAMRYARFAGALYVPLFVLGPFALLYTRDAVVVPGDAAATADQLAAHDTLFRAGSLAELAIPFFDVALALIFYVLLKQVSQPLALLAAFFRLMTAALAMVSASTNFAVLQADPSDALTLLNLSHTFVAIGMVSFAVYIAIQGYLIWISDLLPRIIGMLLMVAAVGYVANSLRVLLVLDWASPLRAVVLLPAFVAEASLCVWLLVKGVRPVAAAERVAAG
jgi:Domain of unknown function (DUF4386)